LLAGLLARVWGGLAATDDIGEMVCQEFVELVTDYLEDGLGAPVRLRFERHLWGCGDCRGYLAQMRTTIRLTGRLGPESVPAPFRQRLVRAFRGRA
jgi:hypothetical protein